LLPDICLRLQLILFCIAPDAASDLVSRCLVVHNFKGAAVALRGPAQCTLPADTDQIYRKADKSKTFEFLQGMFNCHIMSMFPLQTSASVNDPDDSDVGAVAAPAVQTHPASIAPPPQALRQSPVAPPRPSRAPQDFSAAGDVALTRCIVQTPMLQ
jgi:hypothetical protein